MLFNYSKNNDLPYMLEAVASYGSYLQQASKNLKNNKELVIAAIKNNPEAFQYCSEELKSNYNIFMLAFTKDAHVFIHAGEKIRNSKKIALIALAHDFDCFITRIGKKLVQEAKNNDIEVQTYYKNLLLFNQLQKSIPNTYTVNKNKL